MNTNTDLTFKTKEEIAQKRRESLTYAVKHISNDQRVIIIDGLNPEDNAMLQALYSRDPKSVLKHLEKVAKDGTGQVMGAFYVGYGHGSIGQCGYTTICLENVSMLVAKAFQDSALYDGQESSTRYLNMSLQTTKNPANTEEGEKIQQESMNFYNKILKELIPSLKERFPAQMDLDDTQMKNYEKSIKAKAFDIARGFLPAGVTTYLSWTTSLQHIKNRLDILINHPVAEIREVALQVLEGVKETYPDSFGHKERHDQKVYDIKVAGNYTYFDLPYQEFKVLKNTLDKNDLENYRMLIEQRPKFSLLPQIMNECGQIRITFPLDFGSFRDMQRHRPWALKMPLLTIDHGFFPWYLEQLPEKLRVEVINYLQNLEITLSRLDVTPEELQNYIPMGYTIQTETTGGLPQYIYVCELRTQQTVHPTFRIPEQQVAEYLKSWFKENGFELMLHVDMDPDVFSLKRGTQDIVSKN